MMDQRERAACAISPIRTGNVKPVNGRRRPRANLRANAFRCALLLTSRTVFILQRLFSEVPFADAVHALQISHGARIHGKEALSLAMLIGANGAPRGSIRF